MEELSGTKSPSSATLVCPSSSLSLSFAFLYLGLSLVGADIIFRYISMYAFASLSRAYGFEAKMMVENQKENCISE